MLQIFLSASFTKITNKIKTKNPSVDLLFPCDGNRNGIDFILNKSTHQRTILREHTPFYK